MDEVKRCPYCAEEILAAAIKCKHCQSNLGDAPPLGIWRTPVKKGSTLRAIVAVLFTIFFLMWMFGAFDSEKVLHATAPPSMPTYNSTLPEADPVASAPVEITPPVIQQPVPEHRAIFKITAEELYREYDANEVAADEKIGKAIIEVTGTIHSIDKDFTDDVVIHLTTGDSFSTVGLTLVDSQKNLAASLVKGQNITIRCDRMRRILTSPQGSGCTAL